MANQTQVRLEASKEFTKLLKGKTIKSVSYLGTEDMENMMWYSRPVVIHFTDGTHLIPQSDDEGNDGGVLMHVDREGNPTTLYTM